jgi:hypothetical protein
MLGWLFYDNIHSIFFILFLVLVTRIIIEYLDMILVHFNKENYNITTREIVLKNTIFETLDIELKEIENKINKISINDIKKSLLGDNNIYNKIISKQELVSLSYRINKFNELLFDKTNLFNRKINIEYIEELKLTYEEKQDLKQRILSILKILKLILNNC